MKKFYIYGLCGLVMCASLCSVWAASEEEYNFEVPSWIDQADNLLEIFNGMGPEMENSLSLLETWNVTLTDLCGQFDRLDDIREQVFNCVRGEVITLNTTLAINEQIMAEQAEIASFKQAELESKLCEKEAAIVSLLLQQTDLHDRLAAKEDELVHVRLCHQELQRDFETLAKKLQDQMTLSALEKKILEQDLNDARTAYVTLASINEEKAQELIQMLSTLKAQYKVVLEQRNSYSQTIQEFADRVNRFTVTTAQEFDSFVHDITGDFTEESSEDF